MEGIDLSFPSYAQHENGGGTGSDRTEWRTEFGGST